MSYLKFDKNLLINLDQSLTKEMLRTNQAGAYHCSTLIGCNTRKHHGLLVVPIPEKENKSFVMLSSLDETVIQHGAPFNLGIHRYKGGVYSPNGHKYIREYDCETVPKITYRVGGVVLTKEMIFISGENRILLRYTLVDAHSATTLRLKPFLAFRDANALVMENDQLNPEYTEVNNGVGFCLYEGFPTLYMQLNHKPAWVSDPHWYKDLEYSKDRDRGIPYIEDLWVPGYFEIPIKKGESVIFSAGLSEASPRSFAKLYETEIAGRTRRTSFYNCLKNSAKQFYIQDKKQEFLMASYPWGSIRARDTFLALPGTTLAIDHVKDFEDIMATALKALNNYIDNEITDNRITGINQPDIPLWALWAIQQYARSVGFDQAREKYLPEVSRIINWIIAGGHPNLMVDTNGLV
ncbi:MAG: amylo-alpha-1,6-glucosidase, partial [Muribaculum sp.]|nr:amylo-alpha-1,6-glucosidase [Muribaculum sp.]